MGLVLTGKSAGSGGGGGAPSGPAGGDLSGTYPNPDIAANAVGSPEIANNAVGTTEIADAAVTPAKLSTALLGLKVYAPSSITIFSTSSTTFADVDATNAALTFTAPASGKVLVRVSCWADETSGGSNDGGFIGLREASSNIVGTITRVTRATGATDTYISAPMYVTGLSAGSHTLKLSFASAGDTFRLICQDGSVAVTKWGPLIIEAWAAP